jgi:MFS family permease
VQVSTPRQQTPFLFVALLLVHLSYSQKLKLTPPTGTIADLWDPRQAGLVGLSYILAPFLGPSLGPLVGAYIVDGNDHNWKFSIWIVCILCAPVAIAMVFMKETSKSRILLLRARSRGDAHAGKKSGRQMLSTVGTAMLRPLHMIVFEVCLRSRVATVLS